MEAELGVNPFKHGIIGSTDSHNGTPSDTAENDFAGHLANADGTPERVEVPMTFDPEFINGVIGPDGTVHGDECHSGAMDSKAIDVWRRSR